MGDALRGIFAEAGREDLSFEVMEGASGFFVEWKEELDEVGLTLGYSLEKSGAVIGDEYEVAPSPILEGDHELNVK